METIKTHSGKMPDPKEIEKEISEFLSKKFGGEVKIMSHIAMPHELGLQPLAAKKDENKKGMDFDLKPEDLIAYLDQYIVKQDRAKAILATKICTHFNRIAKAKNKPDDEEPLVGRIKNNVLMIGPTGVGKTYMIKLIAKKIGVPFVKGDATKFSETGYVGGDVEDLVRDLVREADGDMERASCGIIYIDEIDKIASTHNLIGADISRTGVQRALLKPMEETEVDMKVPHDPISVFQEIERFRKTGKREKNTINTKNILFIMSGAFAELPEIINKRLMKQGIGFGAQLKNKNKEAILSRVRSEDLIKFGFESEFVGRLPVQAVLERLTQDDLFNILKNPNNPVVLGKKLDFAAYGIDIKFQDKALLLLAAKAFKENTGARGLVSAMERVLLPFERALPSSNVKFFSVTKEVVENPEKALESFLNSYDSPAPKEIFKAILREEKKFIKSYVKENLRHLERKFSFSLTPQRINIIVDFYCTHVMDMENVIKKIKMYADEVKKIELYFYKNHDINIVMEDDAIDYLIEKLIESGLDIESFYRRMSLNFEYGLKLVREKTGQRQFFVNKKMLASPEDYIANLLKTSMKSQTQNN